MRSCIKLKAWYETYINSSGQILFDRQRTKITARLLTRCLLKKKKKRGGAHIIISTFRKSLCKSIMKCDGFDETNESFNIQSSSTRDELIQTDIISHRSKTVKFQNRFNFKYATSHVCMRTSIWEQKYSCLIHKEMFRFNIITGNINDRKRRYVSHILWHTVRNSIKSERNNYIYIWHFSVQKTDTQ